MSITVLGWIATVASIVGVVLNIKRRRECFYVWAATNLFWASLDAWKGIYSQSALQAVYFGLAIWGIVAWKLPKDRI